MATKKRTKNQALRGRLLSAALSLGLLAAAGMVGMYTVGKSEQKKEAEEQARKQAEIDAAYEEARRLAALEEEARLEAERLEERRLEAQRLEAERLEQEALEQARLEELAQEQALQEASSGGATAQFGDKLQEAPELESEFAVYGPDGTLLTPEELAAMDPADLAALQDAAAQLALEGGVGDEVLEQAALTYSFSPDTDDILWPIAGNIILDYSMDRTVYFATLDQYKYNPAILIQGQVGREVLCGANGKVDRIERSDEHGTMVFVDFGNGYEGVYGQLKEVAVEEGSLVQPGLKLGVISEPTHYFAKEGAHVYFQMLKDGEPVDPMDLLQ